MVARNRKTEDMGLITKIFSPFTRRLQENYQAGRSSGLLKTLTPSHNAGRYSGYNAKV